MEMEIRHVSTRRDRATLRGVCGQVIHIRDLERVSGIGVNGWRDALAIIGEGIPALGIESCVQCERNDATLRSDFRRLGKRNFVVARDSSRRQKKCDHIVPTSIHKYDLLLTSVRTSERCPGARG